MTIAPPGSLARVWGQTLQFRPTGGTLSVAAGTEASTYSLPATATIGSLASGTYLVPGVAYLDAGVLTAFGVTAGVVGYEYVDPNHYATSHVWRVQAGVTSVSHTWDGTASSLFQRGYAAAALLFSPGPDVDSVTPSSFRNGDAVVIAGSNF